VPDDEDPGVDLPMTMTASVILTNLPKDASQALGEVEELDKGKGMHLCLMFAVPVLKRRLYWVFLGCGDGVGGEDEASCLFIWFLF
jgi:ubiquitin-like protein ATG12